MTPEQRISVAELWSLIAAMHGKDLGKPVLKMMIDAVEDLSFVKVMEVLSAWPKTSKQMRHPLPVEIREIGSPTPSPEAEAREAIERIKEAITKFGYARGPSACEYIGPVGWKIVQANGGWTRICESDFLHNPGMLAQARNRAEDLVRYKDRSDDNVIQLPTPQTTNFQIEDRKFQAIEKFKEHQAQKKSEITFEIPSDEERARRIQEMLSKKNRAEIV